MPAGEPTPVPALGVVRTTATPAPSAMPVWGGVLIALGIVAALLLFAWLCARQRRAAVGKPPAYEAHTNSGGGGPWKRPAIANAPMGNAAEEIEMRVAARDETDA